MESSGVALGIAGLASLFTTCLQLYDLISITKSHGSSFNVLLCQLEVEQVLLMKWAEAAGILDTVLSGGERNYNNRLADVSARSAICSTLNSLKAIFEDSNNLTTRYGLRPAQPEDELLNSTTQKSTFRASREKLLQLSRLAGGQVPFERRARWVIQDTARFELLIAEIRGFNERLRRLLPAAGALQMENVRTEISQSSDIASLRVLEEASKGIHDYLSHAASQRVRNLTESAKGDCAQRCPKQASPLHGIELVVVEPPAPAAMQVGHSTALNTILEEEESSVPSQTSRCGLNAYSDNSPHNCLTEALEKRPSLCGGLTGTANFARSNPPSSSSSASSPITTSFPAGISASSSPPPLRASSTPQTIPKSSRYHPYPPPHRQAARASPPTEPRGLSPSESSSSMGPPSTSAASSANLSPTPIYQRRYRRPPSRLGSRSPPGVSNAGGGAADYNTGLAVAKSPMTALGDPSVGLAGVKSPMQALIDQERVLAGVKSPMQARANMGHAEGPADAYYGGTGGFVMMGAGPAYDGAGPARN